MRTFYSSAAEIWTPGALRQILEMKLNQIDWSWLNFTMIDALKYESPRCAKQWSLMDEIQVNKKPTMRGVVGRKLHFYGELGLEY